MDYERIDFKTGQVLTADALNHMQDGIEAAIQRDDVTLAAYADLVSLRNEGKLKAGKFYRITDYVTTVAQNGATSAGHQFDVVVLALDGSTLSEFAYAMLHEGDTYFSDAGANLSAWKLWYCLDNDTARFAWADDENGKGVIYRMIDEFNNDIPYDFKNIMYVLDEPIVECEIRKYGSWFEGALTRDSSNDKAINNEQYYAWFYNVTAGPSGSGICYTKEERISVDSILYNDSGSEFSDVKLLSVISEVYTFGMSESADLSGNCHDNSIGVYFILGKQELNRITFGYSCYNNSFGYNCHGNTFGIGCESNTFGRSCYNNTLGNNCNFNTFGTNCYGNTFGDFCSRNTFGNGCQVNTFGNTCEGNTFGNDCDSNSFRESASVNSSIVGYCHYNHFDDGCSYNVIWCSIHLSNYTPLCNININRGVCGKYDAYNYINIETLNSEHEINVNQIDGIVSVGDILSIRHASLKSLRDNGQLIAGQQYRIIDYVTTTSQADTKSAGHQFDIIVTANDNKTLNEKARAIQHEGDTYFANSDLNAWEVWYCLDNDSERFAWGEQIQDEIIYGVGYPASSKTATFGNLISHITFESKVYNLVVGEKTRLEVGPPVYVTLLEDGKSLYVGDTGHYITSSNPLTVHFKSAGVIYRMIDEFGNDCPYDFKNIQFKRYILEADDAFATDVAKGGELNIVKEKLQQMSHKIHTNFWYYGEYVSDVYPDANPETRYVPFGDVEYLSEGPQVLCEINENNYGWFYTFHNNDGDASLLKPNANANVRVCDNTIKDSHYVFNVEEGTGSWYPTKINAQSLNNIVFVGDYCYGNSFGCECHSNTFDNRCYNNSLGYECHSNSFGYECHSNTFGNSCYNNSFGDYCDLDTFGYGCYGNTFGKNCYNNSFGNSCIINTLGSRCNYNTFENRCSYNSFGYGCYGNSFGNDCTNNAFTDEDGGAKCSYIKFDSEVYDVDIHYDDGNSTYTSIRNIHVYTGVKDTELIVGADRNYETCFAKNSSGDVVEFCLADLVQ